MLTQSSWTGLHRSRKWLSDHAANALAMRTIEDSYEPDPAIRFGKALPPGRRKSPFSLDGYLSWMSPLIEDSTSGSKSKGQPRLTQAF
jgi:hypothetical protein